ncbi:MAG: efflux RND transporter periplasmic adaptor subunit [Pseudomonadota bacterium]
MSGTISAATRLPRLCAAGLCLFLLPFSARAQTNVDVVSAAPSAIDEVFELSGTLTARHQARLSPLVDGLVESLAVDAGHEVAPGAPLLRLDATLAKAAQRRARATRAQVQAAYDEAVRRVEEARRLVAERHLPQTELDTRLALMVQAEAAVGVAEAGLREQDELVARHALTAPFAGVITARNTDIGEWVARGDSVLELTSLRGVRLDVQAPQERYDDLRGDTVVEIIPDAAPRTALAAEITVRLPVGGGSGARTFLVRLQPVDESVRLLPGTSAIARFHLAGDVADAVQIPRDALIRHPDGGYSVFVIADSNDGLTAERRRVTLGRSAGEQVQVLSGVNPQERVVTRGNEVLREGERVRISSRTLR